MWLLGHRGQMGVLLELLPTATSVGRAQDVPPADGLIWEGECQYSIPTRGQLRSRRVRWSRRRGLSGLSGASLHHCRTRHGRTGFAVVVVKISWLVRVVVSSRSSGATAARLRDLPSHRIGGRYGGRGSSVSSGSCVSVSVREEATCGGP